MRTSILIYWIYLSLFPALVFAQKALPSGRDEILQAFSRVVPVNPLLDELLVIKESQPLHNMNHLGRNTESNAVVAHFQSDGHYEIYYYSVELEFAQNKFRSIFKPLFMMSLAETSFEQLSLNERKIVSLTVDEASKKKSKKWTSHLIPELKKWTSGKGLDPASCRKAVSSAGNLLN